MKKIILDIDTGIDDALAVAYAVKSEQFDILGLTTTFGNVTLDVATRNTKIVLDHLQAEVPIYSGSSHSLRTEELNLTVAKQIHGEDGLGNTLASNDTEEVTEDEAVPFIIEQLHQHPGEITLLFVGPLTNLAKVLEADRSALEKAREIIIMGGAVTVKGNVTPNAEANIYSDSDAAKIALESGLPMTIVGLDVTMQTLLPQTEIDKWYETGTEASDFFADISTYYVQAYENNQPGIGGCGLHDPLAIGVALDPTFVRTEQMALNVTTDGTNKGNTAKVEATHKPIAVCLGVEKERFLQHFLETLNF